MNRRIFWSLLVIVGGVIMVTSLSAQEARRGADSGRDKLRVGKLMGLGNRSRAYTPTYGTDVGAGLKPAREWQVTTVTYDTAPEWMDGLLIQFYVLGMMRDRETRQNVYSLYKKAVRYRDIRQDRDHMASVFLRPAALERYGEPVAIAAVFSLDGEVVDEISDEDVELPEAWWKNPVVIDSKALTMRDGYLLNRKESPWAVINPDDYEVIK